MNCKKCNYKFKKDDFKYGLNDGVYCEDCYELGLLKLKSLARMLELGLELNESITSIDELKKHIY